jgi:hypothetical protein
MGGTTWRTILLKRRFAASGYVEIGWLWVGIMTIHEKSYNLFEKLLPGIDCPMNAVARFGLIDLSSADLHGQCLARVAEPDCQLISTQYNRDAMKWIAIPAVASPGRSRCCRTR